MKEKKPSTFFSLTFFDAKNSRKEKDALFEIFFLQSFFLNIPFLNGVQSEMVGGIYYIVHT